MERKILVVDDEKQIRDIYVQAFQRAGYEAITAGSAEEALEIVGKMPFQVFFVDLNLPGMDGIELCRKIRNQYPTMTVLIAITGYASIFELTDCHNAGFEDYFTKPANLSELIEAAAYAFKKLARWEKGFSQ
jgi:CheY-like chemotaxis protein